MKTTTTFYKGLLLLMLPFLLLSFNSSHAQNASVSTGVLGTGGGSGSTGSMSFAVINSNPYPMMIDSVGYIMRTTNNGDNFDLYYSETSLGGNLINFPTAWNLAGSYVCNVTVNNTLEPNFKNLNLQIPANTAYRFVVHNSSTPSLIIGNTTEPVNSYTDNGLILAIGDYQLQGGDVGKWNVSTSTRFGSAMVYASLLAPNNAGVLSVDSPTVFCSTAGLQDVYATVANHGSNQINSLEIHWELDGVPQRPVNYTQMLDTIGGNNPSTAQILLGTNNFYAATEIKVWTEIPNGVPDTVNGNDTSIVTVGPAISGNVTVDAANPTSGTNYRTFTELTDALNQLGVCGPVTIDVEPNSGPYNERLVFDNVPGVSSTNFIRVNGNGNTLVYNGSSLSDKEMLVISGTDYVTIDSLNFRSLGSTYGWAALITGNSEYDSIINCEFDMTSITGTSSINGNGIVISGSGSSATASGSGASNCYIVNNRIKGATGNGGMYYGMSISGTSNNNIISNNTIENFYMYGVYISSPTRGTIFSYNDINRATKTSVTTFVGMRLINNIAGTQILGNRIHSPYGGTGTANNNCTGIELLTSHGTAVNPVIIANNLIYNLNQGGTVYGLTSNLTSYLRVYHNSISIDENISGSGMAYGINLNGNVNGFYVANNNVSIKGGPNGDKYGFFYSGSGSVAGADKNNFYVNSTQSGSNYYGAMGANYNTIGDFQAAQTMFEVGSFSIDPVYTNAVAGDLTPINFALSGFGEDLSAYVNIDVFGNSRPIPPTIGAIEITKPANLIDLAVTSIDSPTVFCAGIEDVVVTINNYGTAVVDSFEVHWFVNNTAQPVIHYNQSLDTIGGFNPTFATINLGSYNFQGPSDIKVYISNPNGANDGNNFNDTLVINVGPALPAGVYTVNPSQPASSTNYQSITDILDEINAYGICGAITINIAPGNYNERLIVGNVAGTSPTNTITIDGGDSSQTIITQGGGASAYSALALEGSQYVTVRNLSFVMLGSSSAAAVITSGAQHNTIENCYLWNNPGQTSSLYANLVFSTSSSSLASQASNISYNTIRNNRLIGGYYGIYAYGSSNYSNVGNKFHNNVVDSIYYYGAYSLYQDSLEFIGNSITVMDSRNVNSRAYYLAYCPNLMYHQNYGWSNHQALYISNSGTAMDPFINRPMEIVNNMLYSTYQEGMYIAYARSLKLLHNSVQSEGTKETVYITSTSSYAPMGYDIRNNIFSNTGGGKSFFAGGTGITSGTMTYFDYNIFNTNGSVLIEFDGNHSTLVDFLLAHPTLNRNSLEVDPEFVSALDLHIDGSNANEVGDTAVHIYVDIDNNERPSPGATLVDIGAHEFFPPDGSCGRPISLGAVNITHDSATIVWTDTSNALSYEYVVVSCDSTFLSGTITNTSQASVRIGGLDLLSCYKFYVRSICSSDTSNWAGAVQFYTTDIPYYPVGVINTSDANGVADSLNVTAWTSGIVMGENLHPGNGLRFTLIDMQSNDQEGISIYSQTNVSSYSVTHGDSIMARGTVQQINGLNEFHIDSIVVITSGVGIPEPITTFYLDESTESKFVRIRNFVLIDPSGTGTYTMMAVNDQDSITILVNEQTDVSDSLATIGNGLAPGDTICLLVGIGGQNDPSSSAPYLSGYYVTPLYYSDIEICKSTVGISKNVSTAEFTFYPNPTSGEFTLRSSGLETDNAVLTVRDISGKVILEDNIMNSSSPFNKQYNLEGQSKGMYIISIIDGDKRINKKLILK